MTFIQLKGMVLGLVGRADLAGDAGVEAPPPSTGTFVLAHIVANDREVDIVCKFAISRVRQKSNRPKSTLGRLFRLFANPDAHLREVAYKPFVRLDEHGHMQLA